MHPLVASRQDAASLLTAVKCLGPVRVKVPRPLPATPVPLVQLHPRVAELHKEHEVRLRDEEQVLLLGLQEGDVWTNLVCHSRLLLQVARQLFGKIAEEAEEQPPLRPVDGLPLWLWQVRECLAAEHDDAVFPPPVLVSLDKW